MLTRDFKESVSVEVFSMTGAVAAGFILVAGLNLLETIPSLFILIPGFLEIHGSIANSTASRISAGLFLGVIRPEFKTQRILLGNAVAGLILSLAASLFLGMTSMIFEVAVFGKMNFGVVLISLAASAILSPIVISLTVVSSIWVFRKGHDPNNIVGPYITTVGDILGVSILILSSLIVVSI